MERGRQGKDLVVSSPQGHRAPAHSGHCQTSPGAGTSPLTPPLSQIGFPSVPIMPSPPVPPLHPPSLDEVPRDPPKDTATL